MKDFLIVGNGLAGIFISQLLINDRKNIKVIANKSQNSTQIALGVYNPVVLKRFTIAWEAQNQISNLINIYEKFENLLDEKFIFPLELNRRITSVEEQNNWTVASDKLTLKKFINPNIIENLNPNIIAPHGFGIVNETGYVDTKLLQDKYSVYLNKLNCFENETFNHQDLIINDNYFTYKGIDYLKIIFCEGFGLRENPFFNYLPIDGAKGEILTIRTKELNHNKIVNSSIFILPLGNDLYSVGATYQWDQKNNITTQEAKNELIDQLNQLVNCKYEIVGHQAGVRPTVKDRRPLIGEHPKHNRMYILNGFGTRGVMLAPFLSKILYNYIENNEPINKEVNITRYQKLYKKD